MSNLKQDLIRLGNTNPELREHLRPVIACIDDRKVLAENEVSPDDLTPALNVVEYEKTVGQLADKYNDMYANDQKQARRKLKRETRRRAYDILVDRMRMTARTAGLPLDATISKNARWKSNWGVYISIALDGRKSDVSSAGSPPLDEDAAQRMNIDPKHARQMKVFLSRFGLSESSYPTVDIGPTAPARGFLFHCPTTDGGVELFSVKAQEGRLPFYID